MLALHSEFDFVLGMAIDIMHCVLIGIVKALLVHWFSASKTSLVILCYQIIKTSRAATTSSMEVNEYLLKTFKCVSE